METSKSIVVVAFGDLGRSPRIQNHAYMCSQLLHKSTSGSLPPKAGECEGRKVYLIGYNESEVNPNLSRCENLRLLPLWSLTHLNMLREICAKAPKRINGLLRIVFYALKILLLTANLVFLLGYELWSIRIGCFVVQTPAFMPCVPVLHSYCKLRKITLIVDWHNFGYSLLTLQTGTASSIAGEEGAEGLSARDGKKTGVEAPSDGGSANTKISIVEKSSCERDGGVVGGFCECLEKSVYNGMKTWYYFGKMYEILVSPVQQNLVLLHRSIEEYYMRVVSHSLCVSKLMQTSMQALGASNVQVLYDRPMVFENRPIKTIKSFGRVGREALESFCDETGVMGSHSDSVDKIESLLREQHILMVRYCISRRGFFLSSQRTDTTCGRNVSSLGLEGSYRSDCPDLSRCSNARAFDSQHSYKCSSELRGPVATYQYSGGDAPPTVMDTVCFNTSLLERAGEEEDDDVKMSPVERLQQYCNERVLHNTEGQTECNAIFDTARYDGCHPIPPDLHVQLICKISESTPFTKTTFDHVVKWEIAGLGRNSKPQHPLCLDTVSFSPLNPDPRSTMVGIDSLGRGSESECPTRVVHLDHSLVINTVPQEERPFVIITSTSWTPDENFDLLLHALHRYEQLFSEQNEKDIYIPNLLVFVTGKGPGKEAYLEKARSMNFKGITIRTFFTPIQDYHKLLQYADLGISLHTSSSGLDLPMKVVDMLGAALPVLAYKFEAISEIVTEGKNGYYFDSSRTLFEKLVALVIPDLAHDNCDVVPLAEIKEYCKQHNPPPFQAEWDRVLGPLVAKSLCG